jgi:hypothetical protein
MLIKCNQILTGDPILDCIADGRKSSELQKGIYEVFHFGSSSFPRGYEHYPEFSINCYGVCDTVEQLLEACPELLSSERQFTVTLTPIVKSEQPSDGGWRWHKWGPYIGTQNPQCEYIYDEVNIEQVYVYHIYERI